MVVLVQFLNIPSTWNTCILQNIFNQKNFTEWTTNLNIQCSFPSNLTHLIIKRLHLMYISAFYELDSAW